MVPRFLIVLFFEEGVFLSISLSSGVIAMVLGLVLVPIVSVITPKPDADIVNEKFSCYDREVKVMTKESLGR